MAVVFVGERGRGRQRDDPDRPTVVVPAVVGGDGQVGGVRGQVTTAVVLAADPDQLPAGGGPTLGARYGRNVEAAVAGDIDLHQGRTAGLGAVDEHLGRAVAVTGVHMALTGAGERPRAAGAGGRRESVNRDGLAMEPGVKTDQGRAAVAQGGQRVVFRPRRTGPVVRRQRRPVLLQNGGGGIGAVDIELQGGHLLPEGGHRLLYHCGQFHRGAPAPTQHQVEPAHPQAKQETHRIADHARHPRTGVHHSTGLSTRRN